jgi:pimeloyl-ACP methyl ester carboxylesterase
VLSIGLGLAALSALTVTGCARLRETRAEAAHPAVGQFVTVDGLRVHYVTKGAGPDLILLHGASGNLRDWTFGLMDRLAANFRVWAFDRPGLGYSDPLPNRGFSLADQVAVLRGASDQLGVGRPILLGQSFGGSVALNWALQGGPAALVLLCAPSLPWPGGLDPSYRVLSNPVGAALVPPVAAALVSDRYIAVATRRVFAPEPVADGYIAHIGADLTLRRATLVANARQVNGLRAQLVDMEPRYRDLTLPVELIHGDADTIVPLTIHSEPLAKLLPDARLTVIPGGGHMPQHLHPDLVIEATLRAAAAARLR